MKPGPPSPTTQEPTPSDLRSAHPTVLWSAVSSVGVLLAGFAGADQTLGDPYLFSGLTAVIVGGTTFMGARGDYTHTVIGALILTVLTTILGLAGFALTYVAWILVGGLGH